MLPKGDGQGRNCNYEMQLILTITSAPKVKDSKKILFITSADSLARNTPVWMKIWVILRNGYSTCSEFRLVEDCLICLIFRRQ